MIILIIEPPMVQKLVRLTRQGSGVSGLGLMGAKGLGFRGEFRRVLTKAPEGSYTDSASAKP